MKTNGRPLCLVARLISPLSGDAPHLDSLLVSVVSRIHYENPEPGSKITRSKPLPESNVIIPLYRKPIGGFGIAMASSPILAKPSDEWTEYTTKKLDSTHSGLLDPKCRTQIVLGNGWTKSYRIPSQIRRIDRVAWLCMGNRREILKALRSIKSIGENISFGYGRVAEWTCEEFKGETHEFWPLWIPNHLEQNVLMRPLPYRWEGLPQRLTGWRQDFGACSGPYWHPQLFTKIVNPC